MIRALLVSSLLLAAVLACAPHSPSQPPAPPPECKPALAKWATTDCTTAWSTEPVKLTCADAKKTDTVEFTCPAETTPVVLGTPTKKTQLKSITCGKDGWEFTGKDGNKIDPTKLDDNLGKDRTFSCAK